MHITHHSQIIREGRNVTPPESSSQDASISACSSSSIPFGTVISNKINHSGTHIQISQKEWSIYLFSSSSTSSLNLNIDVIDELRDGIEER